MGYACPVCETPQRDGEHLANHLAFTAMLHGDEHESWLDEHVDGWGGRTPAELADEVTPHATEAEYDEVFEDTTGGGHGHDHGPGAGDGGGRGPGGAARPDAAGGRGPGAGGAGGGLDGLARGVTDEAVESVIEDAREMTEEMYDGDGDTVDEDGDTVDEIRDAEGSGGSGELEEEEPGGRADDEAGSRADGEDR